MQILFCIWAASQSANRRNPANRRNRRRRQQPQNNNERGIGKFYDLQPS